MMTHQVVLIRGDGIGPEITAAVVGILEAAGAKLEWIERRAGLAALEHGDEVLPADTITAIREHKVALKGPCTTPVGDGFQSVNVQLRKTLNLYAAVRPVRNLAGVYIQTIRNVPLLVQLFFWYFAVFQALPLVKEAIRLPGPVYLSNRGLFMVWPRTSSSFDGWLVFLAVGLAVAFDPAKAFPEPPGMEEYRKENPVPREGQQTQDIVSETKEF